MLLTVRDFKEKVGNNIDGLVTELRTQTGRGSPEEVDSWRTSLPILADVLDEALFGGVHLYFGGAGSLSVEYKLPGASGWCDVVLLGRNDTQPSAVIVELKHWNTLGDTPGRYTGLMHRRYGETNHPSDQVKGYVEYCRAFHSGVTENDAAVNGCVLFTTNADLTPYVAPPNTSLASEYPLFASRLADRERIPAFLKEHIHAPDLEFAEAFEAGRYTQPRSLCIQVAKQIADESTSPFVLIEQQRTAFAVAMADIKEAMASGEKRVVIIKGPPGSGKSVVAARIWAQLASESGGEALSVSMVGTSDSQFSNWSTLFKDVGHHTAAGGFVLKANTFIPWTMNQVKQGAEHLGIVWRPEAEWPTNLRTADAASMPPPKMKDEEIGVAIVDEAHALVNPEHSVARGIAGYSLKLGPQAFHIIRGSKVTIFLIDAAQGFRDKESTSIEDLERFAGMLDAATTTVDLSGNQFRCGGSVEYTKWVEGLLSGQNAAELRTLAELWHSAAETSDFIQDAGSGRRYRPRAPRRMAFTLFDHPHELEEALRQRIREGYSTRLLSSYSVPWVTKDIADPHQLQPEQRDFYLSLPESNYATQWSKVWNVVPNSDYSHFVRGLPGGGSRIHEDPLSEVGCPYVVRGFDFDYVGILWLNDFKWDSGSGHWALGLENVRETGLDRTRKQARKDPDAMNRLETAVQQAYRILLTRPIHGAYLWVQDEVTRERLNDSLSKFTA